MAVQQCLFFLFEAEELSSSAHPDLSLSVRIAVSPCRLGKHPARLKQHESRELNVRNVKFGKTASIAHFARQLWFEKRLKPPQASVKDASAIR